MSKQYTYRSTEFKLYLTADRQATLESWLHTCCWIYNKALEHRIKAYKRRKETTSLYDQFKLLTTWRSGLPKVTAVPAQFARSALRRVDCGFKSLFRRVKAGAKKKGFPRFKQAVRYRSIEHLANMQYTRGKSVYIPGLGLVRARGQEIPGEQRSLTIIKRESGWYAQILVATEAPSVTVEPQSAVGIDVGLASFATLSNGEKIENPRLFRRTERKLRVAQRRASRKTKGSRNRRKAYSRVARIHERIGAQRKDFCHRVSCKLVNRFDLIGVEDLNVKGLTKSRFAKSIFDAAWGMFIFFLAYKAESAGRQVVKVDPRYTSQECPNCGAIKKKSLSERTHQCTCGVIFDRDHAAALVIEARALGVAGATRLRRESPLLSDPRLELVACGPSETGSPTDTT